MLSLEMHRSVKQIAEAWGWSEDVIRNIFRNEPGVLKLERAATRTKRGYTSMSIPESVAEAVHKRLSL